MATDDIKIVVSAEDKASGILANVGNKVGTLGGHLTNLAKIAGVGVIAAAGALATFGVASFKAFAEAEKEMVIANQALVNTLDNLSKDQLSSLQIEAGKGEDALGFLKKQMQEVSKSAIQLGFDDEQTSVAFAKLYQVSNSVSQAQADLKLAMDLAAFSGRDLTSAADAVTKVHAGSTRVLKEFGIEVKEGTTAMEALDLMHQRTGGSAESMAKSTAMQLQILGIEWKNLQETVGGALANALQPFIQQLTTWAGSTEAQQKIQEIANGLANFVKQMTPIISQVLPAFIQLISTASVVVTALSKFLFVDLTDSLGTVIFKIMQMIDAIKGAIDWMGQMIDKIQELTNKYVKSPLANIGQSFKNLPANLGIPGFADGGVVPGPSGAATLAVVHGGETVIPAGGRGGFGGIVINITGTFLSEDAATRLSDIIMNRLKLDLRI